MQISNQAHLVGKFNGHLRSCLFLFADEAFWAGDKKGESVLKGLIAEPYLVIEQKGIDAVQWQNRLKIAMAANADWVVPASAGERRYAFFDCADTYVKGRCNDAERQTYFDALDHELEHGGLEAMLHDLSRWELGNWHPRQVYETDALREQKEQSLPPLEEWLVEVLQDGALPGIKFDGEKDLASTRALIEDAKLRVPYSAARFSDKAMAVFLRKLGCVPKQNKSRESLETRGWKFPPLAKMRQEWAARYGGWPWREDELENWQ